MGPSATEEQPGPTHHEGTMPHVAHAHALSAEGDLVAPLEQGEKDGISSSDKENDYEEQERSAFCKVASRATLLHLKSAALRSAIYVFYELIPYGSC